MDLTVHIPDELVAHLGGEAAHEQLERRALEAFALEELRAGRITEPQLGAMLGLHRMEIDGFLKARGVYNGYTLEEVNEQVATLERLGL
jgi:hypothetical protein